VNVGSLYRVKKWYWILFFSKESALAAEADVPVPDAGTAVWAARNAAYYNQKYNENVTYFSPESYIVLLEEDKKLKRILTSGGDIGWVLLDETGSYYFEEVKNE
jgi:hypothetical protein